VLAENLGLADAAALIELLRIHLGLDLPAADKLLEADKPVELALIEDYGVPRKELVRTLLEVKGVYGLPFGNDWAEASIARSIPFESARSLGILPLALLHNRLYCLLGENADGGEAAGQAAAMLGLTLVPLGHVFGELPLDAMYGSMGQYDVHNRRFGEFLVESRLVTKAQLESALKYQKEHGWHIGQAFVKMGVLTEQAMAEELAAFLDMPFYSSARLREVVSEEFTRKLPRGFAVKNRMIALRKDGETVWVATSDPHNEEALTNVAKAYGGKQTHIGIAAASDVLNLINTIYGTGAEEPLYAIEPGEVREESPDLFAHSEIHRIVYQILVTGVRRKASDIHIERYENDALLKYRVDGILVENKESPLNKMNVSAVIAKIKVDARLDISERRRPQDGVIRSRLDNQLIDLRVATQPTIWGENVVIRILNQTVSVPTLENLGFTPDVLARFRRLLLNPQGLILLTGPTGCGKTTTLYAVLKEINNSEIKIVTAEDPVEYSIAGVQQSQVNELIGNTFERFLRGFLRQDPDVILVGEIRDKETAEMTVRAALTGHLIFSTLHVNDAVGVVRRFTDLGIEPNLITQTLLCVISQRLARRVCQACSEPYTPPLALVKEIYPDGAPAGAAFRRGRGCALCGHTGYVGRIALIEFWEPDERLRTLIDRGSDVSELRRVALTGGLRTLVEDAQVKAGAGETTLEELRSVIPYEQIVRARMARS
jgi:type IV pilus assembly protein PilB